jgi:hypothetical protein
MDSFSSLEISTSQILKLAFVVNENTNFQPADSMRISAANNAFGKRDLGNRENLSRSTTLKV